MFLSRLTLNPRNAGARRDLASPYELHRTFMRGLDAHAGAGRLLFRLEPERRPGGPVVLVQSKVAPDWQPLLKNQYLLRADGPKAFAPDPRAGQTLRFRLMANPVKKVDGRRIPLTRDVAQHEHDKTYWGWLHRRAGMAGFEVLQAHDAPSRSTVHRRERYEKQEIPHFGVRFDGVLRVADPAKLQKALRDGIGPAKAFGFGLLSVAPA